MDNGQWTIDNKVDSGMKFRYRSEDEMKDSGFEWIGKIPKMWGLCKVKNIVKVKDGTHDTPKYVNKSVDARPLITSKDIKNGKIDFSEAKYISYNDYIFINTRSDVKKGDVIMPMIGTVGNPVIVDTDNKFSIKNVTLFKTCDNKNLSKFLTYAFQSIVMKEQLKLLTRGGVQNFASLSMLQNLKLVKIPNKYLNRIISFLDQKTTQFDSIIAKKEALIQKLEEAKKSLISEVVTGKVKVVKTSEGYELKKRKKEEMKDSGVEWLGEVPIKWKVTKLKYNLSKIGSGKTPKGGAEVYTDSGVVFIRSQNVYDDGLRLDDVVFINEEINNEMNNSRVKFNDVLLNITGGSIGRSSLVNKINLKANVNQHVCILRPIIYKINPILLHTIIQSNITQLQIQALQNGSNREELNFEQIANIVMAKNEDIQEQELIVEYIQNVTDNVYRTLKKIKLQIDKLKEAKQSLISEAVTGKIEILEN